ncbi:MAG TPA: hypothetical protein VGA66_18025 [Mycobacterium sp.]
MSTKMGIWRGALACAAVLLAANAASARIIDPTGVTTNETAAIVLYPYLKADPTAGVDTLIQLTNTSEFLTKVHCFYTNTNGHCSNAPTTICTDADFRTVCPTGGLCVPGWIETDFRLTLTKRQPLSWSINDGLSALPLANTPGQGNPPQFNEGNIPPVSEVPFTGELICIQVDVTTELPTDRNDLKGEATVVDAIHDPATTVDAAKYNAIGIKAIEGRQDENPNVLNIGGPDAEYGVFNEFVDPARFVGCPNILTLNHFFDGATVTTHGESESTVLSDLIVVPCAQDYLFQTANGAPTVIQFLVYNEFEQRFSTSTSVQCYREVQLSDIDTRPGPEGNAFSIFSAGVQGTVTGTSRLRSVAGPTVDGYDANGILALLREEWTTGGFVYSTLSNVQFQGSREQGDRITIPLP